MRTRVFQGLKRNNGKILLGFSIILLGVMLWPTLFSQYRIDPEKNMIVCENNCLLMNREVYDLAKVAWLAAVLYLTYFMLKTYKAFKETSLFVGLIGFITILFVYSAVVVESFLQTGTLELQLALNILLTAGYALIAVASGWLK